MLYIKMFDNYKKDVLNKTKQNGTLIIVDVQKSFKKFFTDNYLSALNNYCLEFDKVYQIFDNHVDGKSPDKDYLYEEDPDIENKTDLYKFNNEVDLIEKRYHYDVDADFYKKILDEKVYNIIKEKERKKSLKSGDFFNTTEGTIIVYIGNYHQWFHVPKKLYDIFITLKGKDVIIVGGSDSECYRDIEVSCKILGVNVKRNNNFIYSATYCPIK